MKKQDWRKALASAVLGAVMLAAAAPAFAEAPAAAESTGQSIAASGYAQSSQTSNASAARPKATVIQSLTADDTSLTVQWAVRSKEAATGYQVQLAADSAFTQNRVGRMIGNNLTSSLKVGGLKSSTRYYVRVRTYKTVNGQNVFSAWSETKETATAAHVHTYQNAVTKATLTANGKIVPTCTGCGKTGKATVISRPKIIQLAKNSFVYNGKVKRPAVTVTDASGKVIDAANYTVTYPGNSKAVGKHTCKIVFKGNYQGMATREFTITPRGTAIESLTAGDSSLTVKWTARSKEIITGYQVQYAADSNFTRNRASKMIAAGQTARTTVNGLQNGTKYFVRVRTYKTVNGQNIFSAWSEVKTAQPTARPDPEPDQSTDGPHEGTNRNDDNIIDSGDRDFGENMGEGEYDDD